MVSLLAESSTKEAQFCWPGQHHQSSVLYPPTSHTKDPSPATFSVSAKRIAAAAPLL